MIYGLLTPWGGETFAIIIIIKIIDNTLKRAKHAD